MVEAIPDVQTAARLVCRREEFLPLLAFALRAATAPALVGATPMLAVWELRPLLAWWCYQIPGNTVLRKMARLRKEEEGMLPVHVPDEVIESAASDALALLFPLKTWERRLPDGVVAFVTYAVNDCGRTPSEVAEFLRTTEPALARALERWNRKWIYDPSQQAWKVILQSIK